MKSGKITPRRVFNWLGLAVLLWLVWYIVASVYRNNDHYHFGRYSPEYLFVMSNSTVNDFPIVDPAGDVEYSYLGYNHTPHSIVEWDLEYVSNEDPSAILKVTWAYLKQEGYQLKETSGTMCCHEHYEGTRYFVDSAEGKGMVTVALSPWKNNKVLVRLFFVD
jgi:hypothetical protein